MSSMYFILIPLFLYALTKRIIQITAAIRHKDHSKLKAELFFLALTSIVFIVLVLLIENKNQTE